MPHKKRACHKHPICLTACERQQSDTLFHTIPKSKNRFRSDNFNAFYNYYRFIVIAAESLAHFTWRGIRIKLKCPRTRSPATDLLSVPARTSTYLCIVLSTALLAGCDTDLVDIPTAVQDSPAPIELNPISMNAAGAKRPHVILISLDTLRPDYLGFYGHPWVETPNLDALAAESIILDDCMSPAPTTLAAHTSIFTGLYPQRHGVPKNGFVVNSENLMLPEMLAEAGYHTAGFVGSFALSSRFNFNQGFDLYDEYPDAAGFHKPRHVHDNRSRHRDAASVTDSVIQYVEGIQKEKPLFLFVHYFDAHAPYTASADYLEQYASRPRPAPNDADEKAIRARLDYLTGEVGFQDASQLIPRYAAQITYLDKQLGRLFDFLSSQGILDDAILIVTSDHAESLWDHPPFFDHGHTVYQDTIRAVGLLRLPNKEFGGVRIQSLTSTLDFLPTILHLLQLDPPDEQHGIPLSLENSPNRDAKRAVFAQATKPASNQLEPSGKWLNSQKAMCIRMGRWKLIHVPHQNGKMELYDLSLDPLERQDLIGSGGNADPEIVRALKQSLQSWTQEANPRPTHYDTLRQPDTKEALRALGYN